jgi:hypothetical protein
MTSEAIEEIWKARERHLAEKDAEQRERKLPKGALVDVALCRLMTLDGGDAENAENMLRAVYGPTFSRKLSPKLWRRPSKTTHKEEILAAAAFLLAEIERILEEEGGEQ